MSTKTIRASCNAFGYHGLNGRAFNSKDCATVLEAREEEIAYGPPRDRGDGAVEMRPLRLYSQGVSTDRIQDYVERFAALVEEAASRGATSIYWG